ncbi:MAG: InlB B-repeat-containing protein, partial [Acutalibacteraceae bacterium]
MKKTKKILGILLSLALLLNFVPLTALAEPDPGSPEAIYATVELQVGWYADGVFTPLAQGETIDQGEILTVRVLPRSNYLVGPSCYPLMFDSTAFAFVGTPSDRNSFLVNSANYYYNQTCVSYASSQIPTRAWPTGIVPADQMANYTAVKVNFQANTNSANGGYPNVLDGTWLFQFGLQATKNIVYGTNARIWTHETWFRDPSRPSAQGYIPKVLEGQLSSSGSNNYYFDYDFSQNSDYLLATEPMAQSTITFDTAGGNEINPITGNVGDPVTAPADPVKEGFTFLGWDPQIPDTFPADDLTVIAQWNLNSYNLTFDANGGEGGTGPTPTEFGAAITAPVVTKEGHTFVAWEPAVPPTMPAADSVYKATWQVNSYNLTFDADGGEGGTGPTPTEFGTAITAPVVTKEGHTFVAWEPAVPPTMPAADSVYKATWQVNSYNLTFDADGGEGGTGPTPTEFGTAITAPVVTKEGHTFLGWEPAVPPTMPAADSVYKATWQVNSYNLTFDADGGEGGIGPTPTEFGTAITAPVVTKEGYTFLGWEPAVPPTMPAADSVYKATWQINQYTVSFDSNGGSDVDSITQDYGTAITAPAEPTKEGFTFIGWQPEVPATMPAENTECVAQWEAIPTSTITFDTAGGNEIDPITGYVGTPVTAPADPVKDGFNFIGWDPQIPATFPEDDLTVVAQWEAVPVPQSTITFDTAGGNEIDPITGNVGDPVTAPADPVKDGFNFIGWDPQIPATFPEDDLTVVAQWEAVPVPQSTITFDTAGGNEIDPITGNVGDPVTAPADPVKDGFNFIGWDPQIPATFPEDDLTVVAQWEAVPVPQSTITFDTAGGNEIDPITGNVGDSVTAPADPVKDGFNFIGWDPQIPATFPEDDLTVVAQWEAVPVPQSTITFDTDGGNEIDPITGNVGDPVTAPADPVKDGFNFIGWDPQIPATFPE